MADLLTSGQLQEILQVDRTTIYRMVEDGRLPAIRVGKQWRFPRAEVERWLQAQSTSLASTTPAPVSTPEIPAGHLSQLLPLACSQLMQDAFADMLGVMMVITDIHGHPVTMPSNPCGLFTAVTQGGEALAGCIRTWQQLAESVSLEPKWVPSELALLCARGLIRVGQELKGMVVAGGVAPEGWPPDVGQIAAMSRDFGLDPAYLQANLDAVYRLDKSERDRVLRSIQRIADIFSHVAEDRHAIASRLQTIASLTSL
jgi:excisionase family DNA binding protein